MSVVAAIKDESTIWMACDSQITSGYTKETLTSQRKIWKPSDNKDVLVGVVGAWRDANILSTMTDWVDELPALKNEIDFKYVVRTLVPRIFKELGEFGRLYNKNGIQSISSNIIFAYKDRAFGINGDGSVIEMADILVDGSGWRLGLGAWEAVKDNPRLSIKESLIRVVKASCEKDLFVNYPIVIMNTKDDQVEIIERS